MQIVNIAGNVGKDAEFKRVQDSDLCRFSVAVTTGWGDRKATTWWDVTRWGKGTQELSKYLTKGTKVAVSGEVSTREHEGKTYLQIRADHVTLQGGKQDGDTRGSTADRSSQREAPGKSNTGFARDDLDDDVPF